MLKGKRVVMTGITGQVGASIASILAPHNEIVGLARYGREGSKEEAEAIGVEPLVCDYTKGDFEGVPDDFEYVVHLAADTWPVDIDTGIQQNAEGTGLLFNHFRKARAWIYVSTTGVYWDHPDPWYRYKETDRLGGSTRLTDRFAYGTSKFAGETVARTLSRIHDVPVTIPRLNWSYGKAGSGGLPGMLMQSLLDGKPIQVHPDWENVGGPIHEDDLAEHIDGLLEAATVGGTITNWAGDDAVSVEQIVPWLAKELGVDYELAQKREAWNYPRATDNSRRVSLVGECQVKWQDGFRRTIRDRHPDLALPA
jgi:UDP-glucuronate 4-epimerase